ncbi:MULTISPECIES: signal peptidase I [unclassified Microbacterium]|uniref:signal peptidase I n=1 Tax=unclassified Microbacterium TaxID=2609290 RepID=UPI00214B6B89|nr:MULTISPECIES: signal peptidase I [unclassified Microbacterium]MCR2783152.1 signal peptidase I [Microbacterium sp. zg.B96]WIM15968.1 signal peptidase I [Microbacterium sp. zg-B96]
MTTMAAPTKQTTARAALGSRRSFRASREGSLWYYLKVSLSAALLTLTAAVAIAVIVLPAVVGGSAMTVLTQSMEPGLPPGTLIVTKPTPVEDIAVGDVITYQIRSGESAVVTHRVISKTFAGDEVTFIAQGDNNDVPDPEPVREVQVRGTLWYSLPLLGWVNNFLTGSTRDVVVALGAGGLFLYAAGNGVVAVRDKRRKRAAAASDQ